MSILVADDSMQNRYFLQAMLSGSGFQVQTAGHGEEALGILESGGVELIISDILMPVMDGFQLCRKVKASKELQSIPFVFYTATYTGPQDEEFALKIGADRFLQKPCEPDVMLDIIRELLETAAQGSAKQAAPDIEETEILQLYSERLIRKLEQKMVEAEEEILARQKAEQSLNESRERLIAAQRLARMGDFTWDLESDEITWSEGLYDLLGYDGSVHVDYSMINEVIHHPDDRERVTAWLQDSIASGNDELPPAEYRVLCRNGEVLHVQVSGRIRRRSGQKPVVFAAMQDISSLRQAENERRKLQRQLFQAQKMELLGRLAGGVAHDFNNMLSAIFTLAELAIDRLAPEDPVRGDVELILEAAQRSADITRQLLAFARRCPTETPRLLNVNQATDSMVKMLRRLISEGIQLNWQPGDNPWPVKIDPMQFDQILVNLCLNARDAMENGGRITIRTASVSFPAADRGFYGSMDPGDYLQLTVADTGQGMDDETLARIYEPFFTTKGELNGTGLGLSTIQNFVIQNGGFIEVYSEPGKGTTFHVYLPYHLGPAEEAVVPVAEKLPSGDGETILLVEDETMILQSTRRILEKLNYTVLPAASSEEAVAAAGTCLDGIDLLITDVILPDINGRNLAVKIKDICPDTKNLFISGYSFEYIRQQGFEVDDTNFLKKPFTAREIAGKIRGVLGSDGGDIL